jgi:polyhydroxyalkanoate synthesis repressor PhaR
VDTANVESTHVEGASMGPEEVGVAAEVTALEPRLVKRYANRKLYDTRESRYVTLQQIAEFVRDGEEVTIIDNTTKEDLTNVTLAQIIYEEEKKGADTKRTGASAHTLRDLIRTGGERLMLSMGKLMHRRPEEGEEAEGEPAAAAEQAETPEEPRRSLLTSSYEAWDELSRMADDRMQRLLGLARQQVTQLQAEVGRLQARTQELEERLRSLTRRDAEEPTPEATDSPAQPSEDA